MNAVKTQPGIWSIRCYRLLLWLYPSNFTTEFGESIEQVFRDMHRNAFQRRGYLGIALLWFRIVPDFVFSAFELLTSTAGDYLKWYFRLRWVLACALGFGAGSLVAMGLRALGFFEYLGLNPRMGLAGLLLWLGLGFFQSVVLTSRFCHRLRWVGLTALGGVIGTLGSALLSSTLSLRALGPFFPSRWETWALQPLLAILPALVGACIGLFQWFAFRQKDVRILHWGIVCAIGAYISGLLSLPVSVGISFASRIAVEEIMANMLYHAAVGALLGLMTAGPLKRILWGQPAEPGTSSESFTKNEEAS
jgi:hypothetical protein